MIEQEIAGMDAPPWLDPLEAVRIDIALDGLVASYRVDQSYRNHETQPIEAVFTFPVPYGATLLRVEAELAGRRLQSIAFARREAQEKYEDAIASGDSAILVEELSPGLHTLNLGSLGPGETATLAFHYSQFLEWRDDGFSLRVPTTIAPRYGTPSMPEHAKPISFLSTIRRARLRIRASGDIAAGPVRSPTHDLMATREGAELLLVPRHDTVEMDRDIVVEFGPSSFRPRAVYVRDGAKYVAVAAFKPAATADENAKRRVIKILVDCSGSMNGDSIAHARTAIGEIIGNLRVGDMISLTCFGSQVLELTYGVVPVTSNLTEALQSLARNMIVASMGGTEMRPALIHVFSQAWPEEVAERADLFLITDGETWDDAGIKAVARASHHRVFTVGVGAAASEHLLRRLAEDTGGACEIVTPREGMAARVLRHFRRIDMERFEARVDWPGLPTEVWSTQLSPIFAGDTAHVAASYDEIPEGEVRFTISRDGAVLGTWAVHPAEQTADNAGDAIRKLAAHLLVAGEQNEKRAAELALKYELLTRHTGFVMVAERAQKLDRLPALRRVPHMLAAGWYGIGTPALRMRSESLPGEASRGGDDYLDVPAFLRRQMPADPPPPRAEKGVVARTLDSLFKRSAPTRADRFLAAIRVLDEQAVGGLDLAWLRNAGMPETLCHRLRAFRKGHVDEYKITVAVLYLAVKDSEEGRIPREVGRLVKWAFAQIERQMDGRADELLEAVRAVVSGHRHWASYVRGQTSPEGGADCDRE